MIRTPIGQARALLHRLEADREALLVGDFRALAKNNGARERLLAAFEGAPDGAFEDSQDLVEAIKRAADRNAALMHAARNGVQSARDSLTEADRLETYTQDGTRLDLKPSSGTTRARS